MLFNSYIFIFGFLPLCWLAYWALAKYRITYALSFLTLASLAFYAYWNPVYLILLLISILFNYCLAGVALNTGKKYWLHIAVAVNLLILGYFKYAMFGANTLTTLSGQNFSIDNIVLPLGISFFTFHQITYLYDTFYRVVPRVGLRDYTLYISFFPQLIAGPVVRAKEFLPQLSPYSGCHKFYRNTVYGVSLFALGLFKKVLIADQFALYANPVFNTPVDKLDISLIDGWVAALSYTFQLYFDFSGYSDMALGLALLFGFRLPINFYSPYKSLNIAEFWKRWHMTMSRFFRDYLYIPLGGSRCSRGRHIANLLITMTLVGLWHGAGWTFIVWGALHGAYLALHRLYQWILPESTKWQTSIGYKIMAHLLTFICVVIGWVFFRAETIEQALEILGSMAGLTDTAYIYNGAAKAVPWIITGYIACISLPSSMAFFRLAAQEGPLFCRFRPTKNMAFAFAAIFTMALLTLQRVSEFLYFQF